MPIFEYTCRDCDNSFEALLMGSETAACPKCRSTKLIPRLSVFAVQAKGSVSSTTTSRACGSCGDPRGPGSCSLPD